MKTNRLISIEQVSLHCQIELKFIHALDALGHIEIITESNEYFIAEEQLKTLESLIAFHNELQINIEGIDVVVQLLKKIELLQNELMRNKITMSPFSSKA